MTAVRSLDASVPVGVTPRKIVFVAHHVGGGGGMEHVSAQLVQGLLDAGHAVTVVTRRCALPPHPRLTVRRVPTPRRPATLAFPAFFALASLLLRRGDALVHTTGALIGRRADLSTVHYCHHAAVRVTGSRAQRETWSYGINSAVAGVQSRAAERWCYRPHRTRLLVPVSAGVEHELREHFPAVSPRTVPNGVDSRRFRPDPVARRALREALGLDDAQRLALFVGGDWERKGLGHAIDALALAPGWQLAIAGAGDRERARACAAAAGVSGRVHFLGLRSDMPAVYPAADAFVFPTAYEAFPLVALEAAASGVPLLVTAVNGVEDLLIDGENGWFITRDGDDIGRRLAALTPARAEAMGAAARRSAEQYSWEAMTARYLALYAELG